MLSLCFVNAQCALLAYFVNVNVLCALPAYFVNVLLQVVAVTCFTVLFCLFAEEEFCLQFYLAQYNSS